MASAPYTLETEKRPTLGFIILQADEVLEQELRQVLPDEGLSVHITRVPSAPEVTPDTLSQMAETLPAAARLLPPQARFDVVGYGCTSGTMVIGPERVEALVKSGASTRAVSTPFTAALAAFQALNLQRVGIVSPYIPSVAEPLAEAFEAQGFAAPHTVSFGEEREANVARINVASIKDAARTLAAKGGIDAIFLSCTNLRALSVIAPLEAELGLPILSSNQVLLWHMMRLASVPPRAPYANAALFRA